MVLLLLIIISTISLLIKKSKVLSVVLIVLLLFAINDTNYMADNEGYKLLYDYPDSDWRNIEFFYKLITKFFHSIGVSYNVFRLSFFCLYLLIISWLVLKISPYLSYFLSLFIFCTFSMHVVWLRFSMSILLVYISLYMLINNKKWIFALVFMAAALTIHGGAIAFLPLLFINKISYKTLFLFVIGIFLFFYIMSFSGIMGIAQIFMESVETDYLATAYSHGGSLTAYYQSIAALLVFGGTFVVFRKEKKGLKSLPQSDEVDDAIKKVEFAEKVNIYSLSIIPLINTFEAFSRFFHYIFPFYLIIFLLYYKWSRNNFVYQIMVIGLTLGTFIVLVAIDEPSLKRGYLALFHF